MLIVKNVENTQASLNLPSEQIVRLLAIFQYSDWVGREGQVHLFFLPFLLHQEIIESQVILLIVAFRVQLQLHLLLAALLKMLSLLSFADGGCALIEGKVRELLLLLLFLPGFSSGVGG